MIAILKYNAGNTASVANAIKNLGYNVIITNDAETLKAAQKVIIPGVGEASSAMKYLQQHKLDVVIKNLKQPVLGICLGMQILCNHSEEGQTPCLSIFNTNVVKFPSQNRVPHMGWNNFETANGALFTNINPDNDCYFVHSYYAAISNETCATTHYILPFSAALQKNNFYATQFHPEKSGKVGLQILKNFLEL